MIFGKRKIAARPFLILYDAVGETLYAGALNDLPLPEAVILACSEEFFNDPSPCEIHRRAVALRLYAEIEEMIPCNQLFTLDELPARVELYCQDFRPARLKLERR